MILLKILLTAALLLICSALLFACLLRFLNREKKFNERILSQRPEPPAEKATPKIAKTVSPDSKPDFNSWSNHIQKSIFSNF